MPESLLPLLACRAELSLTAADRDFGRVNAAGHGADQPILSGLRYILSRFALAE